MGGKLEDLDKDLAVSAVSKTLPGSYGIPAMMACGQDFYLTRTQIFNCS